MQKILSLTNDISQVSDLAKWVEDLGTELCLPMPALFQLNLALEEAVVNVINYAYPGETGKPVTITAETLTTTNATERIVFILTDEGVPFDPTKVKEPDVTLPAEKRGIGGLGIYLVQQLMEDVTYKRAEHKNILYMVYHVNREMQPMFDNLQKPRL